MERFGTHVQGLRQMSALDVPIYITETGIADAVGDRRPLWLETYIPEVERAVRDGIDVRGLMYWTLVDNFEVSLPLQLPLSSLTSAGLGPPRRARDWPPQYPPRTELGPQPGLPITSILGSRPWHAWSQLMAES